MPTSLCALLETELRSAKKKLAVSRYFINKVQYIYYISCLLSRST